MKKIIFLSLFSILTIYPSNSVYSATGTISFVPAVPKQGEPVMIVVDNVKFGDIVNATIDGKKLKIFQYKNKPTAFMGIDLNRKSGNYPVEITLKNKTSVKKNLVIAQRKKIEETFSIPAKLGGDTLAGQKNLVTSLAQENAKLNSIPTHNQILWSDKFIAPLEKPIISDVFGYSRKTGGYTLTHKGTDYKAAIGTKVIAMNDGIVKVAGEGRNYGKHVVIDHGLGVMTFYLHLSQINVKEGEIVKRGQNIALSGDTGYASGPHLHLSVRIYNISIDPVKFLELFK